MNNQSKRPAVVLSERKENKPMTTPLAVSGSMVRRPSPFAQVPETFRIKPQEFSAVSGHKSRYTPPPIPVKQSRPVPVMAKPTVTTPKQQLRLPSVSQLRSPYVPQRVAPETSKPLRIKQSRLPNVTGLKSPFTPRRVTPSLERPLRIYPSAPQRVTQPMVAVQTPTFAPVPVPYTPPRQRVTPRFVRPPVSRVVAPEEVIVEQPRPVIEEVPPVVAPVSLIERTRNVETVLPVPEYSEVVQEPVIIPIVKPEERSSILRRALKRGVVVENKQDYSPTLILRRKFAPKRRFAPVTEQVQEQRQVTEVVDHFEPEYSSYVDAQASQTVAFAPVDNIPVFPIPSPPSAFFLNNSPSSDVEIAPYAKLVIKSSPRPTISVSSIATSYLSNLVNSTPRVRVSANVERPYRQQSSVSNYY